MKNIGGSQLEGEFMNPHEYSDPPEGWLNATEVYYKLRRSQDVISELLTRAFDKDPNNGGLFLGKDGRVHTYFSPSIVEHVEKSLEEMDKYKLPPEGWASPKELGGPIFNNPNITPKREDMIRETAESFRTEHPEWFKKFNPTGSFETDYYHPELVQKIIEIVKAKEAQYTSKLKRPES